MDDVVVVDIVGVDDKDGNEGEADESRSVVDDARDRGGVTSEGNN